MAASASCAHVVSSRLSCSRRQHCNVLQRPSVATLSFRTPIQTLSRRATYGRSRRRVTTMGLFGLGLPELAVIAGVAALVFGPSKLPELGKGMGKAVKGFQTAAREFTDELKKATEEETPQTPTKDVTKPVDPVKKE